MIMKIQQTIVGKASIKLKIIFIDNSAKSSKYKKYVIIIILKV